MITTNRLDHIVHLTPPASVKETSEQFRKLGFNVLTGGTHEDGLTANALVVLSDGAYFELISYTKPATAYPPGSPERKQRENHRWANQAPGWVDYGFLGNGSQTSRISDVINGRAKKSLYEAEFHGGRKNPDGQVLEWLITSPSDPGNFGVLPFFCGDITSRKLRVPTEPASNTKHPNSAIGVAHIRVLSTPEALATTSDDISAVFGSSPVQDSSTHTWTLKTDSDLSSTLILGLPATAEEENFIANQLGRPRLFEIAFWVKEKQEQDSVMTPFAKIVWIVATPN